MHNKNCFNSFFLVVIRPHNFLYLFFFVHEQSLSRISKLNSSVLKLPVYLKINRLLCVHILYVVRTYHKVNKFKVKTKVTVRCKMPTVEPNVAMFFNYLSYNFRNLLKLISSCLVDYSKFKEHTPLFHFLKIVNS